MRATSYNMIVWHDVCTIVYRLAERFTLSTGITI